MRVTGDTITDEQIRLLAGHEDTTPSIRWECQVALRDPRIKQRANKTRDRLARARERCADDWNERFG